MGYQSQRSVHTYVIDPELHHPNVHTSLKYLRNMVYGNMLRDTLELVLSIHASRNPLELRARLVLNMRDLCISHYYCKLSSAMCREGQDLDMTLQGEFG